MELGGSFVILLGVLGRVGRISVGLWAVLLLCELGEIPVGLVPVTIG